MKLILMLFIIIFTSFANASCEDQPTNEVDWTNCNFSDELDLIGVSLANAKMTGINLYYVNLEKSQLNNSDLSLSNFNYANFNNSRGLA